MIGKPEWFKRRKYTGWGFTPATWQGWAYITAFVLLFFLITALPVIGGLRTLLLVILAIIGCVDFIHIIIKMPRDERDRMHEAISERNALWAILAVLTIGIGYQAAVSAAHGTKYVDPVILIALLVGVVVKMVSNIYLDKKN
ncbi:MAG: hypothetical protein WC764_04690 [Candidatus Paceibacterota bacterium]|jgi:hypothetical protein